MTNFIIDSKGKLISLIWQFYTERHKDWNNHLEFFTEILKIFFLTIQKIAMINLKRNCKLFVLYLNLEYW